MSIGMSVFKNCSACTPFFAHKLYFYVTGSLLSDHRSVSYSLLTFFFGKGTAHAVRYQH